MADIDRLDKMLALLKRHGVKRFEDGEGHWLVEFLPERPAALEMTEPGEDANRCACGHDLNTEHNQFGCLLCTGEKCPKNTEERP